MADKRTWRVDRTEVDAEPTLLEFEQEGLAVRLERFAFHDVTAADLVYIKTDNPFTLKPEDTNPEHSERAVSFQIVLTGRSHGRLPSGEEFVVDPDWGVLTDFADGAAEFEIEPGRPLRAFGGALPIERAMSLFGDAGQEEELEALSQLLKGPGFVRSFRVTPDIRRIVDDAIHTDMTGTLRRTFIESASLMLFSLIFFQRLVDPVIGLKLQTRVLAHKQTLLEAAEWLLSDLRDPPPIARIVEHTGVNERVLNRGMKELFGTNMSGLLSQRRLQLARRRLRDDTDVSLKELAYELGYRHTSNFITAFRRRFGVTPSKFRRANFDGTA